MNWKESLQEGKALFDIRLFEISNTQVTVATLASFALVLVASFWIAHLLQRAAMRALTRREGADVGTAAATARLVRYVVLVVGFAVGIQSVGINLTALFAAGAVFAVAVGFAMQNIAQNFVSGIILLAERSIKPSDILEVDGRLVRVQDMAIRATIARTLDEEDIVIPNSHLVASAVKNYTLRDSLYRLRTVVGVTYSSDMAQVRRVLEKTADKLEWRSRERQPRILMSEFADSSVNWEVSVWIEDPWQMRSRRSDLNEAIWWALAEAGITIAFPQLDVHFDPPVTSSIERLRAAG